MAEQKNKSNENRPTKQEGYTWGTPCITVDNAQKAIDAYTKVFGFTVHETMNDQTGAICWAKLTYKDFGLHIWDPTNKSDSECCVGKKPKSPKASGIVSPVSIYLYNDDVEGTVKKAKEQGFTIIQEPEVMFWGDKMCTMTDANGYVWNVAKNVADFDPSKMPS